MKITSRGSYPLNCSFRNGRVQIPMIMHELQKVQAGREERSCLRVGLAEELVWVSRAKT